jgi:hypothetical protein
MGCYSYITNLEKLFFSLYLYCNVLCIHRVLKVTKSDLNPLEDMNEILGHLIMKCHKFMTSKILKFCGWEINLPWWRLLLHLHTNTVFLPVLETLLNRQLHRDINDVCSFSTLFAFSRFFRCKGRKTIVVILWAEMMSDLWAAVPKTSMCHIPTFATVYESLHHRNILVPMIKCLIFLCNMLS